jgi:hypothetical protein
MHKLALLFPERSELPQLIWIETKKYSEKDENGTVYYEWMGCSEGLVDHVGKFPSAFSIDPRPHQLQTDGDDLDERFQGNQCLFYLARGYASRDISTAMSTRHDWNGQIAAVVYAAEDQDGYVTEYRDVTLNDLRSAIDALSQNMNIFEDDNPNVFVIRDESKWTKAVKVSCEGDIKFLGKEEYRQVEIRKDHPIFSNYDDISTVTQHMGWPLLATKCAYDPAWISHAHKTMDFDPFENRNAWRIMFNVNSTIGIGPWSFRTWKRIRNPTILLARQDQKDVTKYQIQALSAYYSRLPFCLWSVLKGDCADGEEKTRRSIKQLLTAEAFDRYFTSYARVQYEMGQIEWGNRAAQDSGCGTSSGDLSRVFQDLSVYDSRV